MQDDQQKLVTGIVETILEHVSPSRVFLFGSRARGRSTRYSDFDVAIEGASLDVRTERILMDALDERMGIYSVDLVSLDATDEKFRREVLRKGIVIHGE